MTRALVLVFSLLSFWSSPASAEEAKSEPMTEEQWLKTLRGSGSYQTGMNNVRRLIDAAYDEEADRPIVSDQSPTGAVPAE